MRLPAPKGKQPPVCCQDFTFVCPTEIIAFSEKAKQFEQLNCQLIAASCDTEETHLAWIKTPRKKGGLGVMQIPIMADTTKVLMPLLHTVPESNSVLHHVHASLALVSTCQRFSHHNPDCLWTGLRA